MENKQLVENADICYLEKHRNILKSVYSNLDDQKGNSENSRFARWRATTVEVVVKCSSVTVASAADEFSSACYVGQTSGLFFRISSSGRFISEKTCWFKNLSAPVYRVCSAEIRVTFSGHLNLQNICFCVEMAGVCERQISCKLFFFFLNKR